jgi:hypothetical protein
MPGKVVVNLTDKVLDPAAIAILSRGLNFAQSTKIRSHSKEVISGIEQAVQHLPKETAEEVEQEISWITRHSKPQNTTT